MRALLPLALLAAVGCYSPRAVEPGPTPYGSFEEYADDDWGYTGPLEASVYFDEHSGYAWFDVSRPAHVAMFALRPGGSLSIIYPVIGYGTRMAFNGGRHVVRTAASSVRMTGNWSMFEGQGPMYILLVASDDPLDVREFQATRTMGWLSRASITYNPHVALDALVGEIVPRPNTSAWTTAMHVVWPLSPYPDTRRARYLRVQCASGVVIMAPVEAVMAGYPICPEQLQHPPVDSTSDSTKATIRGVTPTRPQPPEGWMTASIGDVDLREELGRLRERHGRVDPGDLEIRPYPVEPTRPGVTRTRSPFDDARRAGSRPAVERTRPEARPSRPSRPEARPAPRPPTARPAPSRPAASRPSKPSRPPKPAKPKPGGGGDGR